MMRYGIAKALVICVTLATQPVTAEDRIPIIDAHSQVDHRVDLEKIVPLLRKGGIRHVILSARGKLKPHAIADFAKRHPEHISLALRTKGKAYADNAPNYYKLLRAQESIPEFKAMAEVILWHAQKGWKAPEWRVPVDAPQVQAALDIALQKNWPFIPHIEFAAAKADREFWMEGLTGLLEAHPAHPFLLVHMGQLSADEAAHLISAYPNIYFLTSHANTVATRKSSQPWTDMFDGERLAPKWRTLVVRHADRFVMAFDNVFAEHWGEFYLDQIALWRKALADLPSDAAHAIAHRNAERLWNLPPQDR